MVGFTKQRELMVLHQLLPNTVLNPALLAAVKNVEREAFLPDEKKHLAYTDTTIRLDETHFMMRVLDLVEMIKALDLKVSDKVLDVGCAGGYSTFVLNYIVRDVIGFDETEKYLSLAREHARAVGEDGLTFVSGPTLLGYPVGAPYDAILVQKALPFRPNALLDQLAPGGRLAYIHQTDEYYGQVRVLRKNNGTFSHSVQFEFNAPIYRPENERFVL